MGSAAWRGGVVFRPGLMAFTGEIGDADAHAHAAVQVLFVARGGLTLTDAGGRTVSAQAAIIPPGVAHRVRAEAGTSGFLAFLDPDSTTAHAAVARLGGLPADDAASWVAAAVPRPATTAADPTGRRRRNHPAVAAALRMAVDRPGGPPRLAELAARVGISASRLSHVFTEQVGFPYAAWRRWVRLQLAMDVVRAGDSLTEAAHAAGFADSAHLTRTCRDLIGISPTEALIATGWRPPSAKVS
ncbi:helix-turn-helix transcriptional regulator [Nocardia farcinica]|uniref:helix-turn-helix transcriptional regulator n=1 Tax=Nocardia farcinica TaxID=37329 RepID=UPI001894048E|nr:AraC family transcriptional regulator [Nocardia farcinica]MBF6068867.1 helix-turn-helix domain-containing protein [Nocardia farcinica]